MKPYVIFAIAVKPGGKGNGDVTSGLSFVWAETIENAKCEAEHQIKRACPPSHGYRRWTVNAQEIPADMRTLVPVEVKK